MSKPTPMRIVYPNSPENIKLLDELYRTGKLIIGSDRSRDIDLEFVAGDPPDGDPPADAPPDDLPDPKP